jgi:hypothetical protein
MNEPIEQFFLTVSFFVAAFSGTVVVEAGEVGEEVRTEDLIDQVT